MNKTIKLIAIFLLGFSLFIAISINTFPARLFAQSSPRIHLIQQGIDSYQTEQFNRAIKIWDEALAQEDDGLKKALIFSNLSLAYQQLGQWQAAEDNINQGLEILNNLDNTTQTYTEILAKALNAQGHLRWLQGNFSQAIANWNLATIHYSQTGNTEQAIQSKLNQVKALQAEGLSSKAKEIIEQIDRELEQTTNPQLKIRGLNYLGNVLRQVGELKRSAQILQKSLSIAIDSDTLLELGNTEKALSDSYLATNQPALADRYAENALAHYQQALNSGHNLNAGLNQLSLAIVLGKWSDVSTLIPQVNQSLNRLPFNRAGIYSRLNFVRSLSCLKEIAENNNLDCGNRLRQEKLRQILNRSQPNLELPTWEQITQNIQVIIQQAADAQTKSYGLGELGRLYELQQQWQLAQDYTQKALLTLEGINAPEISYRWQWQLGRILKQQGNIPGAIAAYAEAIDNLKAIRSDLLVVNSEAQFSFRDNIEPIYRELVDLLLRKDGARAVSQANLERAIQSIDTLQLAEIENFLNCDLSSILKVDRGTKNIDEIAPNTGFIYPIILPDRLEVIFKLPGQPLKYHTNFVPQNTVKQTLRELKKAIIRGYASQVIAKSQIVYDWLIQPLEIYLDRNQQLDTLVFVLDGELRNIPMGVLYDAQKQEYLVQKPYALALLPSFQVFDLQTKPTNLKVLGAGISQAIQIENKSFVGLNVQEELTNIEKTISSSILLNAQFTQPNIQKNLDTGEFSIVHLATHGNFSSNPEETYIVIYDSDADKGSLLKARDLDRLLRQSRRQNNVEILVLSACETAEGDDRATLGLAGLAIRAGAKSTLATLWQVSDRSTIKLMERFYRELSIPGTSKAIALHRAQQALFKDPNYQAPYYWSPYVLIGNWR